LFLLVQLTSDHMFVYLFISRNHVLQQRIILEFLVVIVMENVLFACLFLDLIIR